MLTKYDPETKMYSAEVKHGRLKEYRMIRGRDEHVVEQKALAQSETWDLQWAKQRSRSAQSQQKKLLKKNLDRRLQSKKQTAERESRKAQSKLDALHNLLVDALKEDPIPDLKKLRKTLLFEAKTFSVPYPELDPIGEPPKLKIAPKRPTDPIFPERPSEDTPKYRPIFTLFDKLSQSRRDRAIYAAKASYRADLAIWAQRTEKIENQFSTDLAAWERNKDEIEALNVGRLSAFETRIAKKHTAFEAKIAIWTREKEAFEAEQKTAEDIFKVRQDKSNNAIKLLEKNYSRNTLEGILEYCKLVLAQSEYPKDFPKKFDLEYNPESKLLLVEYSLPEINVIPTMEALKYQPSTDEFKQESLSDSTRNNLYDNVLYKITLRTLFELFKADRVRAVDAIVFNGWVHTLNKATGKKVNTCVLSVHTKREPFEDLDLKKVDPQACFKLLKGVGSSRLHGLAAIAPIMRIAKTDKRFVESYGVAGGLDNAVNLAAMDWEDFEHLVRELFEKEFLQYGGEVKITQASKDGGVDAVAFDPDPIRGGKIVIQAKRYTNVVGVSAVRDLYGTVLNEGATKGILVTTASYGPDAYEFAKSKPLTLLNGSNLLHMLERHGHKAKIDLREAKQILAQDNKK